MVTECTSTMLIHLCLRKKLMICTGWSTMIGSLISRRMWIPRVCLPTLELLGVNGVSAGGIGYEKKFHLFVSV